LKWKEIEVGMTLNVEYQHGNHGEMAILHCRILQALDYDYEL
jgi:hypothetical protein